MIKGKKATDKLLSVYWFAVLFIVAAGIVYIALSFYGKPYDVRNVEADILTNKIADCLSTRGVLIDNWGDLNENNFLETCDLNFNVEDTNGWKNDQFFVRVEFLNITDNVLENAVSAGYFNLENFCEEKLVVCLERKMYSLDLEGNSYQVKIKSIVRKNEKNN